ncbi:MAG: hypothetical protein QXH03_00975 [Candidatus Bathyarchaeia archaeon]
MPKTTPTKSITLNGTFVHGDFAVMLSLHAKPKHWDIGIFGVLCRNSYGNEV